MSLRKLIMILLLGLSLGFIMTGCSSGDTEGDFAEENSDDFSDDFGEESGDEDDEDFAGDGFEDDVEEDEEDDFGDEEEDDEFADEDDDEFADEDDEFADEDDEFADEDDEFADEEGDEEGDEEDDEFADEDFEGEDDEFSDEELEGDGEVAADEGEEGAGDEGFENFDENAAADQTLDGEGTGDDTGVEDIPDEEFIAEAGSETGEVDNDDIGEADPLIESDGDIASDSYAEVNAKLGLVSVKKIYTTPYQKNGRLLNSVYIGRPGDTVVSAAMRIYNQDRSADIIADNPWLADGIKPGEKMYYNSPNRPQDNTTVLTFYEDAGVPSRTYTTKEGDNIRSLATNFLGFDGAWKEVWATNLDVESKDVMPAGVNLKYWPSAGGAVNMAAAPAANPGFAPADPGAGFAGDPNSANLGSTAPIGDPGMAGMNPAMDPTMNAGANVDPTLNPVNPAADPFAGNPQAGSLDPMDGVGQVPEPVDAPPMDPIAAQPAVDLPPENPADMAPPSVDPIGASSPAEIAKQANGNNSMVLLLVGVIALAAVALIAIQIKNKKRPPSMEYTQV